MDYDYVAGLTVPVAGGDVHVISSG
jgi:hypothetical protein